MERQVKMVDLNNFEGIMVDDDFLIVRVRKSSNPPLSGSGKSHVLYTTRGNMALPDGSKVGVNWYKGIRG